MIHLAVFEISQALYSDMVNSEAYEKCMIAEESESNAADARYWRAAPTLGVDSESVRREMVRRIVQSPTFARSERLGSLLSYVCDMALKGRQGQINEQNIGQAVFGRSQDYDSSVDGIVRSQASRLRQRLDLYYQHEGANEPVRILIPRGGYVPVFEAQSSASLIPSLADSKEGLPERPQTVPAQSGVTQVPRYRFQLWMPWGLSAVLGLMFVLQRVSNRRQPTPTVSSSQTHPLWSEIFTGKGTTIVVAPDSGLVLFHGLSGKDINLKQYVEGGYRSESNGPPEIGPAATQRAWLLDLANRRYTSMVDLDAILMLKDRARTLGRDVSVRYARDLRPNDFKTGSVILLGASSANPWAELYERNMNFVLKDDYTKNFWVLNRSPQRGEPARWESIRSDPQRKVFGVVAFLPNLAGNGHALLLEGTSMSGTEAAADFVADDAQLLPFVNRIRQSDGSVPHFEILLETQNTGASAIRSQILAWRIAR